MVNETKNGISVAVRVHPRAKIDAITGQAGDVLKLSLTAPPVEGRANEACIAFFAKFFAVSRSSVTIAAGQSSRNKVIRVSGISREVVQAKINQALADL
jgi:hypothetical protein